MKTYLVENYDLAATLTSGQAFRWQSDDRGWVGVIGRHWVRLSGGGARIVAEAAEPVRDWTWLDHYLQVEVRLANVLATFPEDEPMRQAVAACGGLRLLRQDPWECLASFILSSTKQIVQIQQIVGLLCHRFGEPLPVPTGGRPMWTFPSPERLARATESELRACKMGFRAPNLQATARLVADGKLDLGRIGTTDIDEARAALISLPGVGPKIADCVLLFAYGLQQAFPMDVWVLRALRQLYFPRRKVSPRRLHSFATKHFGPNRGYAQQYLFHYVRTRAPRPARAKQKVLRS